MRYNIGIDLGGTNIAAGVVDTGGKLLAKASIPTGADRAYSEVIADMAAVSRMAVESAGLDIRQIGAVGVGVPGALKAGTGDVLLAVNLGWKNVPMGDLLGGYLSLPVFTGNDADCAALGEVVAGCAAGYDSAIMITLGTGVGGGIIMGRKIFTGCSGAGTEPGHIMLVKDGRLCGCGKRGCFEAYASSSALIKQTKEAMEVDPTSKMWELCGGSLGAVSGRTSFDAMRAGDEAAKRVVNGYIDYVAAGVASLINVIRPDVIIIGGGISNERDYLLVPLNEKIPQYCYGGDIIDPPKAVRATLGNDAGIIGAAMLCV